MPFSSFSIFMKNVKYIVHCAFAAQEFHAVPRILILTNPFAPHLLTGLGCHDSDAKVDVRNI